MSGIFTEVRASEARATIMRLERLTPAEAAPLTDEDLAIFQDRFARHGRQFEFYVKAAYLDYFHFFSSAVAVAANECEGYIS